MIYHWLIGMSLEPVLYKFIIFGFLELLRNRKNMDFLVTEGQVTEGQIRQLLITVN